MNANGLIITVFYSRLFVTYVFSALVKSFLENRRYNIYSVVNKLRIGKIRIEISRSCTIKLLGKCLFDIGSKLRALCIGVFTGASHEVSRHFSRLLKYSADRYLIQ